MLLFYVVVDDVVFVVDDDDFDQDDDVVVAFFRRGGSDGHWGDVSSEKFYWGEIVFRLNPRSVISFRWHILPRDQTTFCPDVVDFWTDMVEGLVQAVLPVDHLLLEH